MFKIVMTTLAIIVAMGWIAYGVWRIVSRFREKNRPKRTTKHLQERKESFERYIKKLENYKKKPYERE